MPSGSQILESAEGIQQMVTMVRPERKMLYVVTRLAVLQILLAPHWLDGTKARPEIGS